MNTKKEYLKSYRLQENVIRTLKRIAKENPTEAEICRKKISDCENRRLKIAEKIEQMTDYRLKVVLYEKYINGHTLEEVAQILNYSKRHTERLHIAALKEFEP